MLGFPGLPLGIMPTRAVNRTGGLSMMASLLNVSKLSYSCSGPCRVYE